MSRRITAADKAEALATLRECCKPGQTVYTVLRHVSRSGMQRALDVYVMEDNQPSRITWHVAVACGFTYSERHEALTVGGCGMDMGFAVVYDLSATLFREGFTCLGKDCPSNDHSNGIQEVCPNCEGDSADDTAAPGCCDVCNSRGTIRKPFPRGASVHHSEGGYTLRQRWM